MQRAISRDAMASFVVVGVVALVGCAPNIEYGSRPLAVHAPKDAPERCYQDARLEVSVGSADWWEDSGARPTGWGYYTITQQQHVRHGLVFYQGSQRLSPKEVLEKLEDKTLSAAFEDTTADTAAADARANTALPIFIGVLAAGTAISTVGLVKGFNDIGDKDRDMSWLAITGAGVGVILLSAIPGAIYGFARPKQQRHYARTHVFLEEPLVPRLLDAMRIYNEGAAKRCNHTGPVDVPMPPSVQKEYGPPPPPAPGAPPPSEPAR